MTDIPSEHVRLEYEALTRSAGWSQLDNRDLIEMTGGDRSTFLHGFCTNDIRVLSPGEGCEAFLTNVQGKITGYVNVFCHDSSLVLETAAGWAESVIAGLDRYVIREDVKFVDRSRDWRQVLVAGDECPDVLRSVLGADLPDKPWSHRTANVSGNAGAVVRRVPWVVAPCYVLQVSAGDVGACSRRLAEAGLVECGERAVEIARLEAGMPIYGRDVTDANLPQEVDRNASAISLTKGCYLGQETVARIDAMGHVNRLLRGLRFPGDRVPEPGTPIENEGKTVATVTSAEWSFALQAPLALAMVRREVNRPGTRLTAPAFGEVEVITLPVQAGGDSEAG